MDQKPSRFIFIVSYFIFTNNDYLTVKIIKKDIEMTNDNREKRITILL
jgi:hypothetical protein